MTSSNAKDVFSRFLERTSDRNGKRTAKITTFHCTFEGDWTRAQESFINDMKGKNFKVEDLGLSTIDCWGPDPDDCAYGHQINVSFPRSRVLSRKNVIEIEKALEPHRENAYGTCNVRYKYKFRGNTFDTFFYGSSVDRIKKELERALDKL